MELDAHRCYRAVASRDARFDGRFFTAVKTTGVYCRPICPAPTPKRGNVRFFACAAAAEAAGYRPCRRCRPETSPGTPAWLGSSATVSRALRFVNEGALDASNGVEDLAARVGVGERQLRRLFREHLGTTPIAVAQTRRLHFARKLIDETRLPITQIAFHAGFTSIRRFNSAMQTCFGRTPSELRRLSESHDGSSRNGGVTLRLPYRTPYNWRGLLDYLRPRATPGVEVIGEDSYRRTIEIGETQGVIEIRPQERTNALALKLNVCGLQHLTQIVERTRHIFDLGADPLQIETQLAADPFLRPLLKRWHGLRVPGTWDFFELGVRAILGQQVSIKSATTMAGRLNRAFGTTLNGTGHRGLTHLFPRPEILREADLSKIGLTPARGQAINALAAAACDGRLDSNASKNPEEIAKRLRALPGIGEWTAQYVAMRALGEPDAFPAGDLGLRKALARYRETQEACALGTRAVRSRRTDAREKPTLSAREVERIAERWRPWRAYAAMLLWHSLAQDKRIGGR